MGLRTRIKIKFKEGLLQNLCFLLVAVCFHSLIQSTNSSDISKREQALIGIIEQNALNLDRDKFYFDPIVVQERSYSLYKDPKKQKGKDLIFRKRNPDTEKDAIALSSEDSTFAITTPRGGKKRQFILLRKSPNMGGSGSVEGTPYFGSFVFVRQRLKNDSSNNVFEIRGVENVVEWDIWETRPLGFFAGWGTCEFTTLFTCESLQEMLALADKEADMDVAKESKKSKGRKRRASRKKRQLSALLEPPKELIPIVAEPGYDPNDYNDLYLDLDFHRVEDMVVGGTKKGGPDAKMGRRKRRSVDDPKDRRNAGVFNLRKKRRAPAQGRSTRATQSEASASASASMNLFSSFAGVGNKFSRGENVLKKLHNDIGGAVQGAVQTATKLLPFDGDPLSSLGGADGLTGLLGSVTKPDALIDALTGDLGLGDIDGLLSGSGIGDILGGSQNPIVANVGIGLKGLAAIGGGLGGAVGGILGGGNGTGGPLGALTGVLGGVTGGLGGLTGGLGGLAGGGGLGGLDILSSRLEELGSIAGLDGLDSVGGLGAVVGGLNKIIGGNLMDVGLNGLTGVLGGISEGSHGPLNIIQNLITCGLGSGASIKTVLGPAGGVFDIVNQQMKSLASGLSGNNLVLSLTGGGEDMLTGSISGVLAAVLNGSKDLSPLDMAQKVLGPIATSLDPVNAMIMSANSIVGGLPGIGTSMGHAVTGGLPSITSSLSAGGLLSTVGLGPVQDLVPGIHDTVSALGETLLSPHNIMGNGVIKGVSESLVQIGLPPEIARLSAIGSQLAFSEDSVLDKGFGLGIRQLSQTAGISLNGGTFRGSGSGESSSGFESWQKMFNMAGKPSNVRNMFAVAYPGAGNREFYIPEGSLIRAKFHSFGDESEVDTAEPMPGFYEAAANPKQFDMFYPDDASKASTLNGKRGLIIPDSYKQPHRDANHGILGTYDQSNWFVPESPPKEAVFTLDTIANSSAHWFPPGLEKRIRTITRPEQTKDNKQIIYGNLFHGIRQSPHIFVADGDSLSGFFVPHDPQNSQCTETPHGVLFPGHRGGHAKFVLDDGYAFENVQELKGAFLPDAMNLAGATGGILYSTEGDFDFNFVTDHPTVDFVYIKDHPSTANVWAAFLSKEEWKYTPPQPQKPSETPGAKTGNNTKKGGLLGLNLGLGGSEEKSIFGLKLTTQKTIAFFPENQPVEGAVILMNKNTRHPPAKGTLNVGKLNGVWKMEIVAPAQKQAMVALFVPSGFPPGDALIGVYGSGEFKLADKQEQAEHFFTRGEQIWVPPILVALLGKKTATAPPKVPEDSTGAASTSSSPPEKAPNYYFGHGYTATPEMEENILSDLPREFEYGMYFIDDASPEPLFVPEAGGAGIFTPDKANMPPQPGILTPKKPGQPPSFVLKKPGSIKDGTPGRFNTVTKAKQSSKGFIKATLKGSTLAIPTGVEIIPGWHYATTQGPDNKPNTVTRKPLKFNVVGVGGGFIGVVIPGPEALDDPNNPIFQEFLHYKAHQDGNVNPWGNVLIFDPVTREAGGQTQGELKSISKSAPKAGKTLLDSFRLHNWEYPLAESVIKSDGQATLKMGKRGNIASMMDFRMFLLRKYSCKRAQLEDGKLLQILAPLAAEPHLSLKRPAQFKTSWMEMLPREKESIPIPGCDGIVGWYAQQNKIAVEDVEQFANHNKELDGPAGMMGTMVGVMTGGSEESDKWTKSASFDEWGDQHLCDEIVLNELAISQATEEHSLTGVELGFVLIDGVGNSMSWPEVAGKLLVNVDEKMSEPPGGVLNNLGATDLLGGIGVALKGSLSERKQANVEANSGEVTEKRKQRRKRQAKSGGEQVQSKNLAGWKTQFKPETIKDNMALSDDKVIFYGLGNCEQKSPPPLALWESKEPEKVIDYYLKVLRIDCMASAKERVMNLFNYKLLAFGESRDFFEVADNPLVNQARLTPMEMRELSIAFELSAFSKTYRKIRTENPPTKGFIQEPNYKISRSMSFITELSLYYISTARRVSPSHSVRLTRNLLKTLRTVLTKLHQDTLAMDKKCPEPKCKLDREITEGDKFRAISLIEFIIHGTGPYQAGGKELKPTFYNFVKLNQEAITQRIGEFARQFPTPRRV